MVTTVYTKNINSLEELKQLNSFLHTIIMGEIVIVPFEMIEKIQYDDVKIKEKEMFCIDF